MKFSRILATVGVLIATVVLAQPGIAKEKVYTWTDSKGVVHYGERPPKDVQAKIVHTRTGHSDPVPAPVVPGTTQSTSTTAEQQQQHSLKDPDRCARAQENIKLLDSGAPIRMQNDKGETVIMTQEQKDAQRSTMQLIAEQACE